RGALDPMVHAGLLRPHRRGLPDRGFRDAPLDAPWLVGPSQPFDGVRVLRGRDHLERGRRLPAGRPFAAGHLAPHRLLGTGTVPELLLVQPGDHSSLSGTGHGSARLHLLAVDVPAARGGRRLDQAHRVVFAGHGPGGAVSPAWVGGSGCVLGTRSVGEESNNWRGNGACSGSQFSYRGQRCPTPGRRCPLGDSMTAGPLAKRLAHYACQLRFQDLPPEAVHEAKRRFIDSIATAVGAMDADAYQSARRCALRVQGNPGAGLFGGGRSSAEWATFVNGLLIRYLDYNDT